ncbi:MAG: PH domain-containing protein, partial [Chloroflexota bacterium]
HPKPWVDRVSQVVALAATLVLVVCAPLLMLLPLAGAPGGFVLIGLLALLLALPLIMRTAVAPAVTVDADGLTLRPMFWRDQRLPWSAVQAVRVFPLLPSEDAEVTRRIAVGRRNYRPAAGLMLVIPTLPPQYRIAGLLAGERGRPVVALTNRAHQDYDQLARAVLTYTDASAHDPELIQADS